MKEGVGDKVAKGVPLLTEVGQLGQVSVGWGVLGQVQGVAGGGHGKTDQGDSTGRKAVLLSRNGY